MGSPADDARHAHRRRSHARRSDPRRRVRRARSPAPRPRPRGVSRGSDGVPGQGAARRRVDVPHDSAWSLSGLQLESGLRSPGRAFRRADGATREAGAVAEPLRRAGVRAVQGVVQIDGRKAREASRTTGLWALLPEDHVRIAGIVSAGQELRAAVVDITQRLV